MQSFSSTPKSPERSKSLLGRWVHMAFYAGFSNVCQHQLRYIKIHILAARLKGITPRKYIIRFRASRWFCCFVPPRNQMNFDISNLVYLKGYFAHAETPHTFALFTRNCRTSLIFFLCGNAICPWVERYFSKSKLMASPSWVTTHPCNHAVAVQSI